MGGLIKRMLWRGLPKCVLAFTSFFYLSIAFFVSATAAEPLKSVEYLHKIWRTEEGLPGPVVKAVIQSKSGYLWLGTDEGLARFDGVRFQLVEEKLNGEKLERWLTGLTETKDGSVWVSSISGGLSQFHDTFVTNITRTNGVLSNYILALHEDVRGRLWIGTAAGLCCMEGGKFITYTNQPGLPESPIRAILEDQKGDLWFGTANGLSRYREGAFTLYSTNGYLIHEAVMSLCEDRRGDLWVGTSFGLTRISHGESIHYTTQEGLAHNAVRSIIEDKEGQIWVGTQGGIQIIRDGELMDVKLSDESPDFEGITFAYSLCEDKEGNIWVGSNLGISRLKPQKFTLHSKEEGLTHNLTTLVLEDQQGVVWVGTYGGGICRIGKDGIQPLTVEDGLPTDYILALYEDRDGTMWVGTDGAGLVEFRDGKISEYRAKDIPFNSIRVIYQDREGNLWLGSNAGVQRFKNGRFTTESGVPRTVVKAITQDRDGNMWFGTKAGLVKWRDGAVQIFTHTNGLPTAAVVSVLEDSNGILWVASERGGINALLKNGRFSTFAGGFTERVLHIIEDDHSFWLGTRSGISSVKKRDLQTFYENGGTNQPITFLSYDRKDGLRRAQCNGIAQPAGWRTREGTIWFPTMHGAVSFNPASLGSNRLPPPITIEQITVDGKTVRASAAARFPPGRGHIEVNFTALSLQAPEKVQFKYKLEGYDADWVDAGTRRVAQYVGIPPGDYKFLVKACNNDGVWNETPASLAFALTPHFYQTRSFLVFCGLLVIASGFGMYRLRITRIRRREAELAELVEKKTGNLQELIRSMESFNYSIAHDLRAPIRAIRGFTEALIEDYRPGLDSMGCEYAKRIEESVDRMDRLIHDLLTYGQVSHKDVAMERVSLDQLMPRVLQQMNEEILARRALIDLRMPMPTVSANSTILEQVFINLISNGIKFVRAEVHPRIEIWAEEAPTRVRVYVRDNGIGIKKEHYDRIFRIFERLHTNEMYPGTGIGLAIVHRGVERMGGRVSLESKEGQGSCFCIELLRSK